MLIADAPAYGLFAAAAPFAEDGDQPRLGVLGTGVAAYSLGGPIVHFAHGQVGRGFGSLGLRAGMVMAGTLGGGLVGCDAEVVACADGNKVLLASMVVGSLLDATLLSWKEAPAPQRPRAVPVVAAGPGHIALGVSGTF